MGQGRGSRGGWECCCRCCCCSRADAHRHHPLSAAGQGLPGAPCLPQGTLQLPAQRADLLASAGSLALPGCQLAAQGAGLALQGCQARGQGAHKAPTRATQCWRAARASSSRGSRRRACCCQAGGSKVQGASARAAHWLPRGSGWAGCRQEPRDTNASPQARRATSEGGLRVGSWP